MTEPSADRRAALQWLTAALLLAPLALLPFGSAAELPIAIAALLGSGLAVRGRIDWRAPAPRWALLLFGAYWLPELLSAPDAVNARRAWREVALDLRYLPWLLFACHQLRDPRLQSLVLRGCAAIVALWLVDALVQAATGIGLTGASSPDRLSGIFGAQDLKLGGAIAVLAPLLLLPLLRARRWLGLLAALACVVVVLLAGARAAWIALALVLMVSVWISFGGGGSALRVLLLALVVSGLVGTTAYLGSERFAARVDRSSLAWQGEDGLDHALSGRLPIWRTAMQMVREHPLNGVGVRGFRDAYARHAAPDDPWRGFDGDAGAFHAHQWLLEVASETGLVGLLCWIVAILAALRMARTAAATQRTQAAAVSLALAVMLFPLNTHYAFYSSAWAALLFFLLGLWLPLIAGTAASRSPARPAAAA